MLNMLKKLKLENFRNHLDFELNFQAQNITVFLGKNAIGKTNILEAIYTLALTKSFRTNETKDLVSFGKGYFRVSCELSAKRDVSLEYFYQISPSLKKSLKKSNLPIALKKYLGTFAISFFSPEELNLIYLEPSRRRRYMNTVLCQIFPEYFEALMKYEKLIIRRNKLLGMIFEKKADKEDINIWNEQIIPYGNKIIETRNKFFEEIASDFEYFYRQIAAKNDDLKISYKSSKNYADELKTAFYMDLARKATTIGPHRDDFEVFLNTHAANIFGSRGECRSIVLALKLAERNFFKKHLNKSPVILLDDVFSELDLGRQEHLLSLIKGSQVFISTSLQEHELPNIQMEKVFI